MPVTMVPNKKVILPTNPVHVHIYPNGPDTPPSPIPQLPPSPITFLPPN